MNCCSTDFMMSMKQKRMKKAETAAKRDLSIPLAFAASAVFYLFFAFRYGVYLGSDSAGYINMISAREPVYPLMLALFRKLFGTEGYLFAVIVMQNLLMAFAVSLLCSYLKKRFKPGTFVYVLLFMPHFAEALLTQYAAQRGVVYTNSIMTEGITLSLWIIFIWLCLRIREKNDAKDVMAALLLCGLMMDIRKQMAVGFITLFIVMLCDREGLKKKGEHIKNMFIVAASIVIVIIMAMLGTRMYNYMLRGSFAQNTRDMNLVLTTTLYVADREDAKLIEEDDVRELFEETMDILDETKSNHSYAGAGLRALEEHYEENYDVITVNTTGPLFIEYAEKKGFKAGMDAEKEADRMSGVIVKSLMADNAAMYLKVYISSLINGLVNTVAARHPVLDIFALAAYTGYVLLMILCFKKKETYQAGVFAAIVLTAIAVNVGVTAALIFCQSRYMIYNMALFYTAGLVMLWELFGKRMGKQR